MRLTKQLEKEILKAYVASWDAYLNGDLKTYASFLSAGFHIVGNAESKQFDSKKEWIASCKKTIKNTAGLVQLKNRKYKLTPVGEEVKVTENSDLYLLINGKWKFDSKFRITTLLQKEKQVWKYVHQDGFLPDAKVSQNEENSIEQIKKDFLRLREAVERQTSELENKKRELEIEAGLEKVRDRSMGMQKSIELREVVSVLFHEMKQLGFDVKLCSILLFEEATEESDFWLSVDEQEIFPESYHIPRFEHPFYQYQINTWRNAKPFEEFELVGDTKTSWDELLVTESDIKKIAEPIKQSIRAMPKIVVSSVAIKNGLLQVLGLESLAEHDISILQRFAKVFDQSYNRFLDLKKAEAQTREAQIELALERVRARTMAMQKSDELEDAAVLLFEQIKALGIETGSCGFNILNNTENTATVWMSSPEGGLQTPFEMPLTESPIYSPVYAAMKDGEVFLVKEAAGKNLVDHFDYLLTVPGIGDVIKHLRETGYVFPEKMVFHFAFFKNGYLSFHTHKPYPEAHDIFKRFAKVFEQTYTRFLDLNKAEAQAREAQIELGLERVRARAMAMQKSDELKDLIAIVSNELGKLDFILDRSIISIIDEASLGMTWWMADPETPLERAGYYVNYSEHAPHKAHLEAWKERKLKWVYLLEGEEKKEWDKFLFVETELANLPLPVKNYMQSVTKVYLNCLFNKFGYLSLATAVPLTEEQFDIMARFAKVFDLTYTRFNDLQKAEAQARESQIQLALERVRARTMAMQKSEELSEVVYLLFQQFKDLGESPDQATIGVINENDWVIEYWVTMYGKQIDRVFKFSIDEPNVTNRIYKAWKEKSRSLIIDLSGKELIEFTTYRESMGGAVRKQDEERRVINVAFFSKGLINVQSNETRSAESIMLLERFAHVFDQTYTRFLDLQKAEAQAREAQIEGSLEKVRATAMSIRKSGQLAVVGEIIFSELKSLGFADIRNSEIIIDNTTKNQVTSYYYSDYGVSGTIEVDYTTHPTLRNWIEDLKKTSDSFAAVHISENEMAEWRQYRESLGYLPDYKLNEAKTVEYYSYSIGVGALSISSFEPITGEQLKTLERFRNVFGLAYRRYADVTLAEAQAREAQIELAMERTRTQSMLMQHSHELDTTLRVFHEQVLLLGIKSEFSFLWLPDEDKERHIFWATWVDSHSGSPLFKSKAINYPLDRTDPATIQCLVDWKSDEPVHAYFVAPAEVGSYFAVWKELLGGVEKLKPEYFPDGLFYVEAFMKYGCFGVMVRGELPQDEKKLLGRFAVEFERTFTRFLDLQKSEAQARESQIQLALERVRARTMAMQKSEELGTTASEMFKQIQALGMQPWACGFNIFDKDEKAVTQYMSLADGGISPPFRTPLTEDPFFISIYDARQQREDLLVMESSGEELATTYRYMFSLPDSGKIFGDVEKLGFEMPQYQITHCAYFSQGYLVFITYEQVPESLDIFKRFATVFEQTYTRFLDLQKAEIQAREAQIETSLERVRSRTMAMHQSNDLLEVIKVIAEQMTVLEIKYDHASFARVQPGGDWDFWIATLQQPYPAQLHVPRIDHPIFKRINEMFEQGLELVTSIFSFEEKNQFFQHFFNNTAARSIPEERKKYVMEAPGMATSAFLVKNIWLNVANYECIPYSDNENAILKRFAKVFEQAYTRFLDLQRAEAQARESQIEAALERVRARSAAMFKSSELAEIMSTIYRSLVELGIPGEDMETCYICTFDEKRPIGEVYTTNRTDGTIVPQAFTLAYDVDPLFVSLYENWKEGRKFYVGHIIGQQVIDHFEYMRNHSQLPNLPNTDQNHLLPHETFTNTLYFSQGYLGIITRKEMKEFQSVFARFGNVLQQSYTRFLDLQRAEAQARESQIEAALEKVRSRTLAMHKSEELAETASELFRQLINLGIEPNRLYIAVIKDDVGEAEFWITDEDGSRVSTAYSTNLNGNASYQKMYEGWLQHQKSLVIDMQGTELEEYFKHLNSLNVPFKGGLTQKRRIQYLAYFSKGFIGMASPDEQPGETIPLLERFAYVFNLTFTRFNDLKIAEAHALQAEQDLIEIKVAKKKAEDALSELQLTQKQLIQSEKMASLGELTAGIAHEIQNPLNFVNNFSEVSTELLDDMKDGLNNGKIEDVIAIFDDLKQNLDKINHHGKRADSIVKGMLMHSRSSTGQMESANINVLCDEYLRLAYHGLRAKDKSFNARLETRFDENVGEINIITQDIGRVILSLLNNAFYAVNEKKKQNIPEYEPMVTVTSSRQNGKIEIRIADNGIGIPEKHREKIFQPFFTTKPTGQGTGLGLSLSYDIITKGHGGELKVETKEGEGSTFIIEMAASN